MIEIGFAGKDIFKYKDDSLIQLVGLNQELKNLIVEIYLKILDGYKFTDEDMEAMKGFYPTVKKQGQALKKNDISVIKISQIEDIIGELQVKNGSTLLKYLTSLNDDMDICNSLIKVEESFIELSIIIDQLLGEKISAEDISIKTDICNINFKKIITTFIEVGFSNENDEKKPLWLMRNRELIDLFLEVIKIVIEKDENITIIIDGLDIRLETDVYNYFIEKLYKLTNEYYNFKVWLIPKTVEGVWKDYHTFSNTYILNEDIKSMGDFETAYESICRNYPSNNIPTEKEVLKVLLELYSFHKKDQLYNFSKEAVILEVFLKLLDEPPLNIVNSTLTDLEIKFLTSNRR